MGYDRTLVSSCHNFPQVSVTNVTVIEGNSSITNAGVKVTLSASAPFPVDVRFQTSPGTATPGLDYISRQGWLHFKAGETVKTISVPVIGDTIYEPNETASLVLLEAVNAGFANSQGLWTIKTTIDHPLRSFRWKRTPAGSRSTFNPSLAPFTRCKAAPT